MPNEIPSRPTPKPFDPTILDQTVIALPLLRQLEEDDAVPRLHFVIIDLNLEFKGQRDQARARVIELTARAIEALGRTIDGEGLDMEKSALSSQYLFGRLSGSVIRKLAYLDAHVPFEETQSAPDETGSPAADQLPLARSKRAIYHIWPDFEVELCLTKSISTVKADAALRSFSAAGHDIIWAVIDSGVDKDHPHFATWKNLELDAAIQHRDFTVPSSEKGNACEDSIGHGTHVAGVIAGMMDESVKWKSNGAAEGELQAARVYASTRVRNDADQVSHQKYKLTSISGIAPQCKILSLKVIDKEGSGRTSNIIAALSYIQEINGNGRRIRIHGVNMSLGYNFDPEWFACGQSPLCVEVDRLVRSGVVVVVAAGNTGYGVMQSFQRGAVPASMALTINDPGNADLAITVGATHRDMPHTYGVSYFSSKGPTGDGRIKPDLVAPGEKIISCAAGKKRTDARAETGEECLYCEDSGTSMAAPHVSGAIAAFLSIRREFIGRPEDVKEIFMASATDLKRQRYFQGAGLVDLMRAIQSV